MNLHIERCWCHVGCLSPLFFNSCLVCDIWLLIKSLYLEIYDQNCINEAFIYTHTILYKHSATYWNVMANLLVALHFRLDMRYLKVFLFVNFWRNLYWLYSHSILIGWFSEWIFFREKYLQLFSTQHAPCPVLPQLWHSSFLKSDMNLAQIRFMNINRSHPLLQMDEGWPFKESHLTELGTFFLSNHCLCGLWV